MNIVLYVVIALVLLLLNEYRLIKKYVKAHENNFERTTLQKITLVILKPIVALRNWIDYKLLNNELNY
ncbi:MAG: hypothetical protein IPL10_17910 [Bacteroidetes bacterium]|nr:hypothetical protein [Bacteroidota bacterium]MBK8369195.1 hypothetical protein [Bacteroidota bacterium]